MEFVRGVNRVVIHTSVHQPVDRPPGLSLNGYGQFFNRLETWSEQAGAWMKYIARCSFLLQQGRAVADVAYFYGEEAPVTGVFGDKPVDIPQGYAFDFVNADALANRLSVSNGELATASGQRYRVLYLGGTSRRMTFAVLQRIADLVEQGAVLVGRKPDASLGLHDDPAAFTALAAGLFGASPHAFGKGSVYPSGSLAEAFRALRFAPDFTYGKPKADTRLLFAHRRLADGDLYFVSNRLDRPERVSATFRTSGYRPEIWDAVTGKIGEAEYHGVGGTTDVSLSLPANGSAFVVFRWKSLVAASPAAPSRKAPY